MVRLPIPSEARLEVLLREAFEFMPGPDMGRLAGIEQGLLRAARRPAAPRRVMLPWWVLLLLAGGAATAAWWAGEHFIERNGAAVRVNESAVPGTENADRTPAPDETGSGVGASRQPDATSEDSDQRIIYERETP